MIRTFAAASACLLVLAACETLADGEFEAIARDVLGSSSSQSGGTTGIAQADIEAGLRQALEIGTERVATQIGVVDGYWRDPQIRIPLPGRLADVQTQLARIGQSGPLDDLELRMNRAAESAVPEAKAIVIDAVRGITIDDALQLLNGSETAATDYLRRRTEGSLSASFTPHVEDALAEADAYLLLDSVVAGNPLLNSVASDYRSSMTEHAVQLGLDGVFYYLAKEEQKIRENPVARTTELLRRVFGS
ncbi:MAG: DUF4197 domain-containing protein [Pseudomonadota bacterium]